MKEATGYIGEITNKDLPFKVVGAGFSGLVTAYYLKKNGFKVTLFEKNKVGGKLQSIQTQNGIVEYAANAYYSSPEFESLFQDLNIKPLFANKKLKKWIWFGKAKSPISVKVILKIIFSLLKRIPPDELNTFTIYDFFQPLTGKKFAKENLSAMLGGVYATTSDNIAFKSVFKSPVKARNYFQFFLELRKNKKKYKPRSVSFEKGVHELIEHLRDKLQENIIHKEVKELDNESNWIICTDAIEASKFFAGEEKDNLSQIQYTPLDSYTLTSKKEVKFLKRSFGIVIPPVQNRPTLGVINNSAIFTRKARTPSTFSYTLIAKPTPDISNDINDILGLENEDLINKLCINWKRAIPIYNLQQRDTILKLRVNFLDKKNKVLIGNYINGISLREILKMAINFSESLNDNR